MSVREKLTAIADAIRSARGAASTEKYSIDEMPEKISEAVDSAFDGGWFDGHQQGINEGIDAGKKSQYDEFWDNYQNEGNRTNYSFAFSQAGWKDITFKPKYEIKPTSASGMFYYCNISDLRGILEDQGVVLDLSKVTDFANFFQASSIKYIGVVDITGATTKIGSIFQNCYQLQEISEFIVKESNTFGNSAFGNCAALYLIKISGTLGSSIGFPTSSLLTHESLMSIINALKKLDTGITATLTLHEIAKSSLTDSEKATITQKGWTLA